MFKLKNTNGQIVNNREGKPFTYSNRILAGIAKRILEAKLETKLRIVEA